MGEAFFKIQNNMYTFLFVLAYFAARIHGLWHKNIWKNSENDLTYSRCEMLTRYALTLRRFILNEMVTIQNINTFSNEMIADI